MCNELGCNRRRRAHWGVCIKHGLFLLTAFGPPAEARNPAPLGLASPPPAARPSRFVDIVSGVARTAASA